MSSSFRKAVLVDSSAILALADETDRNHRAAFTIAKTFADERRPVFVTNYLQAEAHALLLTRLGRFAAGQWLFHGGMDVVHASRNEEAFAHRLLATYEDKDWSLCDATSFAVIEGRRAAGAFSFDHHFLQYSRFRVWGAKR